MPISERVAYHEAGHALLVYLMSERYTGEFNVIEVRIFEPPLELILGLTMFNRNNFMSSISVKGKAYAKDLIKIAWGGCIAEEFYDRINGNLSSCSYGGKDIEVIYDLLKSMSIEVARYESIKESCRQEATALLNGHSNQLTQIANLFKSGEKSNYSYSDISEIMHPL